MTFCIIVFISAEIRALVSLGSLDSPVHDDDPKSEAPSQKPPTRPG
jgi:hypothetical protein